MKACKVTFALELLLQTIGLEHADQLEVYHASTGEYPNCVTLYLKGEHPDIPNLSDGGEIPSAMIVCMRDGDIVESRLEMR